MKPCKLILVVALSSIIMLFSFHSLAAQEFFKLLKNPADSLIGKVVTFESSHSPNSILSFPIIGTS